MKKISIGNSYSKANARKNGDQEMVWSSHTALLLYPNYRAVKYPFSRPLSAPLHYSGSAAGSESYLKEPAGDPSCIRESLGGLKPVYVTCPWSHPHSGGHNQSMLCFSRIAPGGAITAGASYSSPEDALILLQGPNQLPQPPRSGLGR